MKLTTGILVMALMAGGSAAAQSPDAIDNARNVVKSLNQPANAPASSSSKPVPGAPAPAIKPAVIPGTSAAPAKAPVVAKAAAAAKPAASGESNHLKHVSVVPGSDNIQIEISSSETVTPRVSKLSAPARVLVELPGTAVATGQNKIPVGSGGVKGIRIGMDGKTPPTTSVVVDLEKALPFELAPGSAGKVVLIVHTDEAGSAVAKSTSAPATKAVAAAAAPKAVDAKAAKAVTAPKVVDAKASGAAGKVVDAKAPVTKTVAAPAAPVKVAEAKGSAAKPAAPVKADGKQGKTTVVAAKPAPAVVAAAPVKTVEAPKPKEEKKWAMSGKRDPFFSPVVQQNGSGCSTGKKCLEIGAINLRGVVKSETGFIAVVTNNLNKAYFLRENDPVFNGYVVKITGDSVVFSETLQDKLGKPFTREVVKRIFTPAV